jgi:hypothetical protein
MRDGPDQSGRRDEGKAGRHNLSCESPAWRDRTRQAPLDLRLCSMNRVSAGVQAFLGSPRFETANPAGVPLRSSMSGENSADRDALLETFAAELTLAAYRVALPTTMEGNWVDLELGLWRALAEQVKSWGQHNFLEAANR